MRRASSPWLGDRPPHLPCSRGDLPPAVLFPGDPGRLDRFANVLDGFRIIGQNREFRVGVGRFGGVELGVCSTGIGGPSTEITVVEAAGLGVRYGLRVGGCGALRTEIETGSLLVVKKALRGGGAAALYGPGDEQAQSDAAMMSALQEAAGEQSVPLRAVTVASTDSYYLGQARELPGVAPKLSLEVLRERGADALEMEAETLLVVGKAVGMQVAALLAVHANRATDAWLEDFGPAQDRMLRVGCAALAKMLRSG